MHPHRCFLVTPSNAHAGIDSYRCTDLISIVILAQASYLWNSAKQKAMFVYFFETFIMFIESQRGSERQSYCAEQRLECTHKSMVG